MKKVRIEHEKIYLDATGKTTHAIVFEGNQITHFGKPALDLDVDEVITPDGACVMPALADAHIHMWGLGLRPNSVSLRDFKSARAVYAALEKIDTDDDWIFGHDWDQHQWTDTDALSIEKLDAIFPNQALMLRRIDGHAIWVNSVALDRAGTTATNGLLLDEGLNPIYDAAPATTLEDDRNAFFETADTLIDLGITSVHIAWVHANRVEMLETLNAEKKLPLRIHTMLGAADEGNTERLSRPPHKDENCWLNFNCVKYFADGALGSKGAQLLNAYDDGTFGEVVDTDSRLTESLQANALRGWQPAVHAIGDRGAQRVLDQYDSIPEDVSKAIRPRLEHAQMLTDDDLERMKKYIASIQPIHQYSDCEWADTVLKPFQIDRLFRWRELADRSPICGGSDYPIEDLNPWHAISVAVSRAVKNRKPFRKTHLTRNEAIDAYTSGASYAAFWEDKLGRLSPGYFADFIVPDTDPFMATPSQIWNTEVLQVWQDGKRIR